MPRLCSQTEHEAGQKRGRVAHRRAPAPGRPRVDLALLGLLGLWVLLIIGING